MIDDLKERRKKLLQQNKEIYQELITIDRKLRLERPPEEWALDLFMAELITNYVKTIYFEFKDGLIIPLDAESDLEQLDCESGPAHTWMKNRMKDFKDVPGFDNELAEIQHHIIEILKYYRKQWDAEWEQKQKKRIATLILY